MLRREDIMTIKALKARGVYQKDIAEQLGVHPKTVSRALKGEAGRRLERPKKESKLEAYKGQIDALLAEGVWNAVVILREIQAAGYTGGSTILRQYIAPKRGLRAGRATVRYETQPGEQLQSDWGEVVRPINGEASQIYFIVNELGYSRRFHFWCAEGQDAEHTYEGLIRSFEYFGGVPAEVLVDNQKTAVLHHVPPSKPQFNERFVDLADHYGFRPRACRPYRARTKGKDERMVGYVKHHFFVRYRAFESWAHLNQLAEQWLRTEADQRLHGTVKEVVSERFGREEQTLGPLPAQRYDTSYHESRRVGWDGYIDVRGNRYSVPSTLCGERVQIRIGLDQRLRVYADDKVVVDCLLRPQSEGWVTVPEHHQPLWEEALHVEHRPLDVYEEVAAWS